MALEDGMDLALQQAIVTALRANSDLMAAIGSRLYEDVPAVPLPTFPYINVGETQELDNSVQFLQGSSFFVDIHVWTRTPGFVENKQLSNAVRTTLDNIDLVMPSERLVTIVHRITRTMRDPDQLTKHGVVTMTALTERTADVQ
jgi:hypothetical protein